MEIRKGSEGGERQGSNASDASYTVPKGPGHSDPVRAGGLPTWVFLLVSLNRPTGLPWRTIRKDTHPYYINHPKRGTLPSKNDTPIHSFRPTFKSKVCPGA